MTHASFRTAKLVTLPLALALTLLAGRNAEAHPYASGVSNTIPGSSAGTIKFILNEDVGAQGDVTVNFDNNTASQDLGGLFRGVNSFPLSGHTNFSIVVTKTGSGSVSQISSDANNFCKIFGPRGVAVNKNPKTSNFGRTYISNASQGAANGRTTPRGFYIVNADQTDAIGQGDTARTAGIAFSGTTSGTTFSPWRVTVGSDDQFYISDDMTNTCTVWVTDPDVTTSVRVLSGSGLAGVGATVNSLGTATSVHGRPVSRPVVVGSTSGSNLVLYDIDTDFSPGNAVQKYVINGGPLPWASGPSATLGTAGNAGFVVDCDLALAPDGKLFVMQNRQSAGGTAGDTDLRVYDTDGTSLLWSDYNASGGKQPLFNSRSVDVSPDGQYVATIIGNGKWTLMRLTNGLPDLATLVTNTLPSDAGTDRSICFDAADNVYTVSGGSDLLRVFSLGLSTSFTTYNDIYGTNGSFQVTLPPSISVSATTPLASQGHPTPTAGVFTITRSGASLPAQTVFFSLSGTADPSTYTASASSSISFGVGATTATVTITPINDSVPRPTTTVVLTLLPNGANYNLTAPTSATVFIQNTATPTLSLVNVDTQMYERTNDFARFRITRIGDTNADLAVNVTFGGTATNGANYYSDSVPVDVPLGAVTTTFKVYPIHDGIVTSNLTVTATLASGSGYALGSPTASGNVLLVDADLGAETVLWADDFTTNSSGNWTVYFASTNNAPVDYNLNNGGWSFDYGAMGIPPAPHTTDGSTLGLYMSVNKADQVPAAAALNLYPTGKSFSGNYALRFDMYLIKNDLSSQTEYALFGINHDGAHTNWFRSSTGGVPAGWNFDGLFYDVEADGAALGDYVLYSSPTTAGNNPTALTPGRNASTLTDVFKTPPWTATGGNGGAAANVNGTSTPIWADVEVSQKDGVIYWKINQTLIFSYANTTAYTSGNIMLGYEDGFDSIGKNGGAVIYDNVRVVSLASAPITITSISTAGGNVTIGFTAGASDAPAQFSLQASDVATGGFINTSSTITSPSSGNFQAVKALGSQTAQFYRIRRL